MTICEELRTSVLKAAFSGHITNRCSDDSSVVNLLAEADKKKKEYEKLYHEKRYPSLSETTCFEEPFEIPDEWRWAYLGDIFRHNAGKALNAKNTQGTLREYLTTSNVYWDHFETSNLRKMYYTDEEIEKYSVQKGDLLVLEGGDVGRAAIWDQDKSCCIQNHLHRLRPFVPVNIEYFYNILKAFKMSNKILGKGIGLQGLSATALNNIVVPIPSVEEQSRVVSRINELMAKIDELESIEKELEEIKKAFPGDMKAALLQAAMQGKLTVQNQTEDLSEIKQKLVYDNKLEPVTEFPFDIPDNWEWVQIGNLGDSLGTGSFSDGPFGSNLKTNHYISKPEVRIIQLSNIGERGWRDQNIKYTSFKHLEENIPRCEVKPGDFVIAKMMPAGRTIEVPELGTRITLGSDSMKFKPNKILNKKYLLYAMRSQAFLNQVYADAHGITRVRTTLRSIKSYVLPIPPLQEQERIVEKLDKLLPLCDGLLESKLEEELEEELGEG